MNLTGLFYFMKNREIKFRGLSETGWKFGYLFLTRFTNINQTGLIPVIQEINETEDGYNGYKVEKETLGQLTALKDKNGVDIYEGDILMTTTGICSVIWSDASFALLSPGSEAVDWEHSSVYELSEIIGNIHENPDLLNS